MCRACVIVRRPKVDRGEYFQGEGEKERRKNEEECISSNGLLYATANVARMRRRGVAAEANEARRSLCASLLPGSIEPEK